MSHQRSHSHSVSDAIKNPHTVSLKVLRLSRPSLAQQYPLPSPTASNDLQISPKASLAYPFASDADPSSSTFILTPLMNLPQSFQSAYVGESFSCTLCANNELPATDAGKAVSGIRISAEMVTPSCPEGLSLALEGPLEDDATGGEAGAGAGEGADADTKADAGQDREKEKEKEKSKQSHSQDVPPGGSLQKTIRIDLREEGNHTLAVTVTYTETTMVGGGAGGEGSRAAGGRVRTFRKLYQFVAAQCLTVKTKAGEIPKGRKVDGPARFALEAQLENVGEGAVCLEAVQINPKPPFKATSLNWDAHGVGGEPQAGPILNPRDVVQVAFLLEQQKGEQPPEVTGATKTGEKRLVLGQLAIQWRTAMGDHGSLSTGWLTGRSR